MSKKISLNEILEQEKIEWINENPEFVLDTNSLRYNFTDSKHQIIITSEVLEEFERLQKHFPINAINQLNNVLNPAIIHHFPDSHDEYIIGIAAYRNPKIGSVPGEIGWTDLVQIAYGLERARHDKKTMLISNDPDVLNSVKEIRRMEKQYRDNLSALSISKYLRRKYQEKLQGHEKPYRLELIRIIEEAHHAA